VQIATKEGKKVGRKTVIRLPEKLGGALGRRRTWENFEKKRDRC